MNKIFKVIWNYATQSWVAVSELQKAKGKTKSLVLGSNVVRQSFPMLKFSLITSGLLFASGQVIAATGTDNTAAGQCYYDTTTNSVICGNNNTKNSKTFTTSGASSTGERVVAVGANAEALNNQDIAIGFNAGLNRADQGSDFAGTGNFYTGGVLNTGATTFATNNGISIGTAAGWNSSGQDNVSIGRQSSRLHYGESSITIGTDANNYAMHGFSDGTANNGTIDALARNTKNTTTAVNRSRYSVAIGRNAMTYDDSSISIGDGAKSIRNDSIAIGTGARSGMAYKTVADVEQGQSAIAIGHNAVAPLGGDLSIGFSTGSRVNQNAQTTLNMRDPKNISVGALAGQNTYGYQNMVFGVNSGNNIGTAAAPNYGNTAMGYDVGNNIRGDNNVNVGYQSGKNIMSNSNTGVGSRTAVNIKGANNAVVGYGAGNNISGSGNLALGQNAGQFIGTLQGTTLNTTTGKFMSGTTETVDRGSSNNISGGQNAGNYVYGNGNVAFGKDAGKNVGHKTTAFGTKSDNNMALGENAGSFIEGSNNLAFGSNAGKGTDVNNMLVRDRSISQGYNAMAYTHDSLAIGTNAKAGVQSANGTGVINAIAIGPDANASAVNSMALGRNARALNDMSVALGTNSFTAAAVGTNNATVRGISYSGFAGTSPSSTVSIGHAFGERTITNVAAGRISATSTDAINGSQLYAVANNISWNITASASDGEVDGVSEERVYAGEQVKLDAGKNIKITQNGQNFTFATLENVSFTNVTTGETSMDNDGLKVGGITITNTPITVNGTPVNNINEAINQTAAQAFSPLTFVGDEGSTPRKLGETLNIVAGNATDTSTKNLKTTVTEGKVEISMAENPVFETVQVGGDNGPKISADGDNIKIGNKDGNPTKITNVAPAELSENSKDAVNGSQLYQTNQNVTNLANNVTTLANNTIKLGDDNGTTTDAQELSKDGGLQFNVKGENGLSTKAEGSDITVTIAQSDIDVKDDGTVSAKNSGNTYATAEQVANAINKAGWFTNVSKAEGDNAKFFTTEAGKQRKVSASDKVIFQAGKNMEVKQDGDNIIYATSENVTFNTVQVGGDNGPKISADGDNIKIGDKAGNPTKITNVAAGTNATDAVNVSQLNNAAAGAKTEVEAGDHISVNQRTGVNGQTIYNVSVTTGNITKAESTGANAGKVTVADTDKGKVATVDNVAEAINSAGWLTNVGKAEGENANFFTTKAGEERKVSAGDKVIFQAGKNMEVKQDGDNVIYATSENVTFNTVQVGGDNGPKITGEGNNIKIGDKDGNPTKITNVAAGEDDNDAVNVSQLKKATAAAKTVVEGDQGVSVTPTPKADGSVTYTVAAKTDGTTIKIDASGNIAANTGTITPAPANATDAAGNLLPNAGKVTVTGTPVGNETQEQANAREGNKLATVGDVANAINSAGWVVNTGKAADQNSFNTAAVNHQPTKVSAGSKVNFQAGKNMEVKRDGENIIYATSDNVSFNTVTVGNTKITNDGVSIVNGPSMTKDGIDAGGKRITNVAPGRPGTTDAVNMQQLRDATTNINNQLNKMDKRRKAGHASGLAVAGLMQAYREGQSAVTAGVGQYQNQSAVAVGYSRIADSGKYGVKAAFTANTQGEVGGTLSAGYFW